MTLDLVVLIAVAIFATWGAFTGFARQVAQALAGVGAFVAAGPCGRFFAQPLAQQLKTSLTVGVVVATVISFVLIYVLARLVLTLLLRRLLAGRDPENRRADRALGFVLGGLKAALLAYVGISAATFVENNLVLAGKKYTFTPKDSALVKLAREYNLVELLQFQGAHDFAKVAKLAQDPKAAAKLKDDPDWGALMRDKRFRDALNTEGLKQALETGDVRSLLRSNEVVELIHDPKALHHLERVSDRAD